MWQWVTTLRCAAGWGCGQEMDPAPEDEIPSRPQGAHHGVANGRYFVLGAALAAEQRNRLGSLTCTALLFRTRQARGYSGTNQRSRKSRLSRPSAPKWHAGHLTLAPMVAAGKCSLVDAHHHGHADHVVPREACAQPLPSVRRL